MLPRKTEKSPHDAFFIFLHSEEQQRKWRRQKISFFLKNAGGGVPVVAERKRT